MIGQTIGHYHILKKLGSGGMGEVWLAEDIRLERRVALKFLPYFAAQDQTEKARFIQEAKAAARLSHAHLAQVHEIGEEEGRLYIVMEYVPGGSLRDVLDKAKGKSLPLEKVLSWVQQTAEGLAEAHSHGIIHRDIKPDNLMLTEKGQVKITDFGLARLETATRLTASGTTLGTVNYMSPELITGKDVDHRADLFSLGATFYEMLTGQQAFAGQDANSTYYAILNHPLDPIARYRKDLPDRMEEIVAKLLERDTALRYQSAAEVAADIKRVTTPTTSSIQLLALTRALSLQVRKLVPTLGWLVAAVLIVALVIQKKPTPNPVSEYRFRPFATSPEPERNAAWSPDGQFIAYLKQIEGRYQVVYRHIDAVTLTTKTSISGISSVHAPIWSHDGTKIYFLADQSLWSVGLAEEEPRRVIAGDVIWTALHPTEEVFVCWDSERLTWATPPDFERQPYQFQPQDTLSGGPSDACLRFSPDGRKMGLQLFSKLWILPWPSRPNQHPRFIQLTVDRPSFDWLDTRYVILGSAMENGAWILDTKTEDMVPLTPPYHTQPMPSVSPDRRYILQNLETRDYDLVHIPLDGSRPYLFLDSAQSEYSPSWSSSGDVMAYITDRMGEDEIWIRDSRDGTERRFITKHSFSEESSGTVERFAAISPDGQWLAFLVRDRDVWRLWLSLVSERARPVRALPDSAGWQHATAAWSPDSQKLVVGGSSLPGNSGLRIVERGRPETVTASLFPGGAMYPTWSPDGKRIACCPLAGEFAEDIALISPAGQLEKVIPCPVQPRSLDFVMIWSREEMYLYVVSTYPGEAGLYLVNVDTGISQKISQFNLDLRIGRNGYALHSSMTPDNCIATTRNDYSADIWLLERFISPDRR